MIDCFVEVAIGEVGDCGKIKITTTLTKNNQFGRIKSQNERHWFIVSLK